MITCLNTGPYWGPLCLESAPLGSLCTAALTAIIRCNSIELPSRQSHRMEGRPQCSSPSSEWRLASQFRRLGAGERAVTADRVGRWLPPTKLLCWQCHRTDLPRHVVPKQTIHWANSLSPLGSFSCVILLRANKARAQKRRLHQTTLPIDKFQKDPFLRRLHSVSI